MTSKDELLDQLGSSLTKDVVPRFHRFAYVPDNMIDTLAR